MPANDTAQHQAKQPDFRAEFAAEHRQIVDAIPEADRRIVREMSQSYGLGSTKNENIFAAVYEAISDGRLATAYALTWRPNVNA
jgi:hypothetical protein